MALTHEKKGSTPLSAVGSWIGRNLLSPTRATVLLRRDQISGRFMDFSGSCSIQTRTSGAYTANV